MSRIYGPGPGPPPALRPVHDLAGSTVEDAAGRRAGHVFGSLVDAGTGLLRYLDVALDNGDRHVLVPIGHVRIQAADGSARVVLQAATREDLDAIPTYEPGAGEPGEEYQRDLLAAHGRIFYGERYYAHPSYDHSGLFAGEHPIVRDGAGADADGDHEATGRLAPLSRCRGVRVAPGEPDIRGWGLTTGDGRTQARVRDLIIDPDARKVRYVIARRNETGADVLLPVGFLRIDARARRVHVPVLDVRDLASLPRYGGEPITSRVEHDVRDRLNDILDGDRRFGRPDFHGGGQSERPTPSGPSARSRK